MLKRWGCYIYIYVYIHPPALLFFLLLHIFVTAYFLKRYRRTLHCLWLPFLSTGTEEPYTLQVHKGESKKQGAFLCVCIYNFTISGFLVAMASALLLL